ncbi:MAG: sulfatase-like hydrolase/transferase, partial [Phycisphaerae bacterium]
VTTPSLMTGMLPIAHTVHEYDDRQPAAATTMAEVFREAGYATLSLSSISFTGKFTNLHQGFEELHESASLPDGHDLKTAREYVDRLLPWLQAHRDVPFFVFLHVADPHDPFEARPPYAGIWADLTQRAKQEERLEKVRPYIKEPTMKRFGMPTRAELVQAGIDADAYIAYERDLYDGAIRGMDAEIGRLLDALRTLGLERETLVVFSTDHGEEFLDHGKTFHGQSVYGELSHAPLILRQPGVIPAGRVVENTVASIHIMPTILELCRLPVPDAVQGSSMLPLLFEHSGESWTDAPAYTEQSADEPDDMESYAVVFDGWKLIHNTRRDDDRPEFELFDHADDPLDQRNLADEHPELVERLAANLTAWRERALAARLPSDAETAESFDADELERLRNMGYME